MENTQGNGYRYIGSLIYNTGSGGETTESAEFSQGRIIFSSSTAHTTHYHHRDHLGSVRAITDGAGTTIEQNAYYTFGGRHSYGQTYLHTTANRHKFNGKEEQTIGNLGLLDYGARMYDHKLARWLVQDPLGEEMYNLTPYRFSLNNPIKILDPDGLFELSTGKIEKGDNLSLITQILNSTYKINLSLEDVARVNKIENINMINAGDYIILPGCNVELSFNLTKLQVVDQDYDINIPNLSWKATSGRNGYQDKSFQNIPNKGPIPEGEYIVDNSLTQKISDISTIDRVKGIFGRGSWPGLEKSWGEYRTWISPIGNTNTYGRNNFSIHGGLSPGSAGCIDLTSDNNSFHKWLLSRSSPIKLVVNY